MESAGHVRTINAAHPATRYDRVSEHTIAYDYLSACCLDAGLRRAAETTRPDGRTKLPLAGVVTKLFIGDVTSRWLDDW